MKSGLCAVVIALFTCLSYSQNHQSSSPRWMPGNKVAFLRDSTVWVAHLDGSGQENITPDSNKLNNFLFSPDQRYLAYSIVVGAEVLYGDSEDDSTADSIKQDVCSIVIYDLQAGRMIRRTDPEQVYLDRWLPANKLFFHTASDMVVSGYFIYSPETDSLLEIPDPESRLEYSDFTRDELLEAYATDHARKLRLYDRSNMSDSVIVGDRGIICDIGISNDRNQIAFVAMEETRRGYFDVLWLFDRSTSDCKMIYRPEDPRKPGSTPRVQWSSDDRYLGMFYSPAALILDMRDSYKVITVDGENFSWYAEDKLLFNRGDNAYMYDISSHSTKPFLAHAENITVLR